MMSQRILFAGLKMLLPTEDKSCNLTTLAAEITLAAGERTCANVHLPEQGSRTLGLASATSDWLPTKWFLPLVTIDSMSIAERHVSNKPPDGDSLI